MQYEASNSYNLQLFSHKKSSCFLIEDFVESYKYKLNKGYKKGFYFCRKQKEKEKTKEHGLERNIV